ncbi:MAG: Cell division inhibitor [uncultured Sulfurovum sp.]|uniref:Cell division inhibitor n=1 Tax=uncultured Sulfurovum sp. TaxID=269237 RepID=A0A6S6TKK4_9BACT|nr:MAG: Cell division inhibitor [uncultured Sulfurovum sp.]
MKKVVIFGGSGFLGVNLAKALLKKEYEVVIVSRNEPKEQGAWRFVYWDAQNLGDWVQEIEGAEAFVNLVGRTVDCIKTAENCDAILRSRVDATKLIGKALPQLEMLPKVWVQMSTAHLYGDSAEVICDESSTFGYGLAPYVGKKWEEAYLQSVLPQIRQVLVRTSFVLGKSGGALKTMAGITKFGLGGKAGHGQQGISWIHEEDMNRIFIDAIENETREGAYIATAPKPVSNEVFMKALRKALSIPVGLPAFSWMVKLGAMFVMKTDPDLVLAGRYCVPKRLEDEGFEFEYGTVDDAFENIFIKGAK